MIISIKKNLSSGIFSILFGVGMLITIPYFIKYKIQVVSNAIGPDYLPKIVAILMLVCGTLLVIKSLVFKKDDRVTINLKSEIRTVLYIVLVIVFIVIFKFISFLIAALLAVPLSLLIMEDRNIKHYIAGEILAVMVWAMFKFLLHVPFG